MMNEEKSFLGERYVSSERYVSFFSSVEALASYFNYLGRFDAALNLLRTARQISLYPDVDPGYYNGFDLLQIEAEIRIASYFLTNRGRDEMFDLVQNLHRRAEAERDSLKFTDSNRESTMDVAIALNLLGQAHYYDALNTGENDYSKVLAYCRQSLDIWELLVEEHEISIAHLTPEDPEVDEHTKHYVLHIIERWMSKSLFYTGLVHERHGANEQAKDFYQRALDFALHISAKEEASYAYRHLAGLSEDKEQQLEYALQSLHLREEIDFKRSLPLSHLLVCDVYLDRNDLEKAQEHCQNALQLAEEMKMEHGLVMAFLSQGEIYQRQSQLDDARKCFVQSADIAKNLGVSYCIAITTMKLQELG
jgi:tetratricopeptide (TPR) repeat protein